MVDKRLVALPNPADHHVFLFSNQQIVGYFRQPLLPVAVINSIFSCAGSS